VAVAVAVAVAVVVAVAVARGGNDKNTKIKFLPFGVFITWDP
jgi:high-affinity Fe2+/Pb2+ permease